VVADAQTFLTDRVRSFLDANPPRYGTLATINNDGSPHQIVIWFLVRGNKIVINSRRGRRWPKNLERDGRANLAVYEGEDAVTVYLSVDRVYDGDPAQADIAEMAHRYDEPGYAASEIARYITEDRVTFVMRPTKVNIHGEPH
jgi:hypothetical protein